jgi:16S rRNA (guanine527-N7)-methyltransferase
MEPAHDLMPDPADRAHALAMFDVSRETSARLDRFVDLLLGWQRHTNLISNASIGTLWTRHVADSLQLLDLAPKASTAKPPVWIDLGSGGGFPGMVIACALADVPGACIHLIESNAKKAAFLREAVTETGAPGLVHAGRIEALGPPLAPIADFVTARALAPLRDLCALIEPILKNGAQALLPKGQDLDTELTEATKYWNIDAETASSKTSSTGRILIVRRLSRRKKP